MDLQHDWKALNGVFFRPVAAVSAAPAAGASTLVLLEDDGKVVDGVASNGRIFEDVGLENVSLDKGLLDGLAAKYSTEQAVVLPRKRLDEYIAGAATLGTNYFQQLAGLRADILAQVGKKSGPIVSRRNFVVDLFGGILRRLLPRRFNVLVFVDDRPDAQAPMAYRAVLLSYVSGKLDQFYEPDFSSLHHNRLVNWQADTQVIGRYLENRYILPCYGVFIESKSWRHCLEAPKPWGQFVRYYDDGLAGVYPKTLLVKCLIAIQRLLGYFNRL